MKKLLSIVLTLAMLASAMLFVIPASAEDNAIPNSAATVVEATYGDWGAADLLFDRLTYGNHNSKWCLAFSGYAYVIFKYNQPINVSSYIITTGNDTNQCPERNPEDWTLYGSKDHGVTWEVVHQVTDDQVLQGVTLGDFRFDLETPAPAYDYYKFEVTRIGGGGCLQLAELQLIDKDAPIFIEGTVNDHYNTWGSPANIVDGINQAPYYGSKWCLIVADTAYVTWKYTQPKSISAYSIFNADDTNNYPGRLPSKWTLYGSNNGTEWEPIHSVTEDPFAPLLEANAYGENLITLDAPSAMYSYFKFEVTQLVGGNCLQLGEVSLHETEKTIDFSGVQVSDSVSDTFAVRFLSTVDELSYNAVGYRMNITYKGATKTGVEKETSEVYTSVVAGTHNGIAKEVLASELGGAYIQALTIYNIDATAGDVVFEITPYTVKDGVTSDGYSYAITVNNGVVVSCARLVK